MKNRKLKQLIADLALDNRRELVRQVQAAHGVCERRSCLALGVETADDPRSLDQARREADDDPGDEPVEDNAM